MQDVSFIRIDDLNSLDAAGISRTAIARKVYNCYLKQFFVTYRIHADPHPGNLFIRPLPTRAETAAHTPNWPGYLPGDIVPYAPDRPFQLVLVDFGMFVEMPPRLREALRDFAIGLGLRDARRILDSYSKSGVVQPGADLDRLEEMIQTQLDELWGTFLGQMRQSDLTGPAAKAFFDKYEALMSSTPFQFQTEMLFMMRAMGMLSGVTSNLDPEFDPWKETAPFARGLIQDDLINAVRSSVQDLVAGRIPPPLISLLRTTPPATSTPRKSGTAVPAEPEEVRRLRNRVNRLTAVMLAGGLCAAGVLLQSRGVEVTDVPALLWPGNNLGKWLIETSAIMLAVRLLRRDT
jgi:predicted unusual protein kinase regulating ubiquinone biosynthesis (AarF/ABC1/UbiB family)